MFTMIIGQYGRYTLTESYVDCKSLFHVRIWPELLRAHRSYLSTLPGLMKCFRMSIGNGNMMVEFFSAEMVLSVCR